ncbi:hypothetical protein ACJJTC_017232, partial [Scirpophaga incertulas]
MALVKHRHHEKSFPKLKSLVNTDNSKIMLNGGPLFASDLPTYKPSLGPFARGHSGQSELKPIKFPDLACKASPHPSTCNDAPESSPKFQDFQLLVIDKARVPLAAKLIVAVAAVRLDTRTDLKTARQYQGVPARSLDAPAQQRPGKAPGAMPSKRTLSSTSLMRAPRQHPRPQTHQPTCASKNSRDPRLQQRSQDHPRPPGRTSPLPRVASPTPDNPLKSPQPFTSREASKEEIIMKARKRPPEEDISAQRPGALPRLEVAPAIPPLATLKPIMPSDIYPPQPSTSSSFVNYPT